MTTRSSSRLIRSLHAVTHAASAAVILVGCLVLVGWMLDIQVVTSLSPDAIGISQFLFREKEEAARC